MPRFGPREDFHSLSVQDLLEARDHYHVHLSHRENVIGTAVGLYRIRVEDPDAKDPYKRRASGAGGPRTLRNTVTRKWSWPCVLVFVNKWTPLAALRKSPSTMEDLVPSRLFLPDGRVVPTCVIYSPTVERRPATLRRLTFPAGAIGGGFPILTDVQGEEHIGSVGCLVTDGNAVYGLTNRHVVGDPGTPIYTLLSGNRYQVGVSDRRQVGKLPFPEVYSSLGGAQSFANLDAGLIRLDDIRQWTSQIYGIGQLGALVNLTESNVSLDLIGCPVRAFGAASGELLGAIMGLFFRYRTVGGADFVADFLIGPRANDPIGPQTRPGDSGTVWCWDRLADATESSEPPQQEPLRPMAVQWGGQALLDADGNQTQFALATTLSQICRALDVDVVREWGVGLSEYWGKVGHYKVGAFACELVTSKKLRTLMMANQERIGVSDADLKAGKLPNNNQPEFVALADVADLIWRSKRGKDAANHFADLDEEGSGEFEGRTLMDLWFKQPSSRNPQIWTAFYDALGDNGARIADRHRGALPFRVAEIYSEMVGFVAAKDVTQFVCAAGLLAHYVGDACQPLHVSHLHHGRPGHPEESEVHSVYETQMLDRRRVELVDGVNKLLEQTGGAIHRFKGAAAAAHLTVELMKKTLALIDPLEVIDAYNAEEGQERVPHMWNVLGARTMKTIANGARALATIWQSAWVEGGGNSIAATKLVTVPTASLRTLYLKKDFLESNWLKDM